MGRLLLTCLLSAHLLARVVMGRMLWEASAPGAAELLASGASVLPSAGVSLHEGELGLATAPADALPERHRPFDRSVAGAEVMLGGLATAVLAAVFCYIQVTRRRSQGPEEH